MQTIFYLTKLIGFLLLGIIASGDLCAQKVQTDTIKRDTLPARLLNLKGHIVGGVEKELLPGAYIYLGEKKVAIMTTDQKGEFLIPKLTPGKIKLTVSYIGYQEFSKEYDLQNDLDVGEVRLEPITLDEVIIKATPPLSVQRNDTTQFNMAALKVPVDADLEDLLKKLPGFEIVNGKIMAQGKEVTKLYVDGMEYSFNDPAAALKNLPAKLIAKIKMYDDQSEEARFSGYDDGQKFRSLNIETHNPNQMKVFGTGKVGYGITEPLSNTFKENNYQGSLSANLFDRKRRITLNGDIHSTGQDNDLPGSHYDGSTGNNNSQSFYANFSSNLNKKIMFSGNYNYRGSKAYSASLSKQVYFPTDRYENRIYDRESHSWGDGGSHSFNVHSGITLNEKNKISVSSTFSASKNDTRGLSLGNNVENNDTVSLSDMASLNKIDNLNVNGNFTWMHAFPKQGRTFTVQMSGGYNRNLSDQAQNNHERTWNEENISTDTVRNLLINNHRTGNNWSGSLTWSEPLTEHARLSFNYSYSNRADYSNKKSLSFKDQEFEELIGIDTAQTNKLENIYREHKYGMNYNYFQKKVCFNSGLAVSHTQMENCYQYLGKADSLIKSNYVDLSPRVNVGLNFSESSNLDISYSGSSSSPNAVQLQDILDVSNPLQVSKGNPDLKKSYNHSFGLNYTCSTNEKRNFFYGSLNASQTFNQITSNVRFIQRDTLINDYMVLRGARFTTPVNLNGMWNFSANGSYSFPWKKLKTFLTASMSYNFSHSPSIYDDLKNITDAHTGGIRLGFNTNISENFSWDMTSNSSYSYSKNSTTGDAQYFSENIYSHLYWSFWKNIFIRGGYDGRFYINKKGEKVNQGEHILNASLGKKFGKSRQMELAVEANDILKERNTINYSLNDLYSQTSYQTRPSASYLLSFSYRFNSIDRLKNKEH